MRKTGLAFVILFFTQVAIASFPKSHVADSLQSSLPSTQQAVPPLNNMSVKKFKQHAGRKLFFTNLSFKLLHYQFKKEKRESGKSNWIASVGGFLLGLLLGPVGYGIVRLISKNKAFCKGALVGLEVFGALCVIYIMAVVAVLLIFLSLGLY